MKRFSRNGFFWFFFLALMLASGLMSVQAFRQIPKEAGWVTSERATVDRPLTGLLVETPFEGIEIESVAIPDHLREKVGLTPLALEELLALAETLEAQGDHLLIAFHFETGQEDEERKGRFEFTVETKKYLKDPRLYGSVVVARVGEEPHRLFTVNHTMAEEGMTFTMHWKGTVVIYLQGAMKT